MLIFNLKVKILVKKEMRRKPEKEKSFGDTFFFPKWMENPIGSGKKLRKHFRVKLKENELKKGKNQANSGESSKFR